jgi:ribulose-5-phosphate 4-epimerase/fuculose-1-phosphate aldolase
VNGVSELRQKVVQACRILDEQGIMDELGHFSARLPKENLVLMNGKVSPGQATDYDIVMLDLQGNKIDGRIEPAKETPLHLSIYQKRGDVMAIAHTHSPMIVALSIAGVQMRGVDNLGATVFGTGAPLFEECGLVDTFDMGYRIVTTMGSSSMVVLKGHGNIVTGESVEQCCVSAVWAEKAARLLHWAIQVGKPQGYAEEEVRKVREQVIAGKAYQRAWNYYRWKLSRRQL